MGKMKHSPAPQPQRMRKLMRQFGRREDGSIIVFSLFLLTIMLILGGMAIDFMRFEARRSKMQGVADRATLAATNMRGVPDNEAAEERALDYIVKAGLEDYLVGDPQVEGNPGDNYRSVKIDMRDELDTFFLHLAGIDTLVADASSTALQGSGNVEISLTLDISTSMRHRAKNEDGTLASISKIEAMRNAAIAFTNIVLADNNGGRVSLSVVPYGSDVNIGPGLFSRLNVDARHNLSHCVEFEETDFNTVVLDTGRMYEHVAHFQRLNRYQRDTPIDRPVCPQESFEKVSFVSKNRAAIVARISQLVPQGGTSIFLGAKWGLALLDPSTREIVNGGQEGQFAGRPVDYADVNNPNARTDKILVLMTDGEDFRSYRIQPDFYDTPEWVERFRFQSLASYKREYNSQQQNNADKIQDSDLYYMRYSTIEARSFTRSLCNAAKEKDIRIFSVAFNANGIGTRTLKACASSEADFYPASASDLTAVFEEIASRITSLRLTQ